jgi:phenylalanyl-tRNA synthetase beta chain
MLEPADPRRPSVRIANPVSEAEPYLRTTLLPGLFAAASRNIGRGLVDIALFESGPVFRARPDAEPAPALPAGTRPTAEQVAALDAALPDQPQRLAVVLCGRREAAGWWGPGRVESWADAIEAARVLARALGIALEITADPHAPFHPGRCAALRVAGDLVGHAGELHPRVVEAFDLPERTSAMELSLDAMIAAAPDIVAAPVVSAYPAASLDVAVVVDRSVPSATVAAALQAGAGALLEAIRLFDVYEGDQVGTDRKSLAFALRLRASDRTLTAEEATAVRDAAVAVAAERCGAELRG